MFSAQRLHSSLTPPPPPVVPASIPPGVFGALGAGAAGVQPEAPLGREPPAHRLTGDVSDHQPYDESDEQRRRVAKHRIRGATDRALHEARETFEHAPPPPRDAYAAGAGVVNDRRVLCDAPK